MKRELLTIGVFVVLSVANIASATSSNVDDTTYATTLKQSTFVQYSADNDNSDNDKSCCKKRKLTQTNRDSV
jgi:hypothetical protein